MSDEPNNTNPDRSIYAGRYRLVREIGRGGMGSVHEAIEIALERVVAIKRLTTGQTNSLEARQRFRREVTAAARLTHPGIAQVLDFGTTDEDEHYIVMELVRGRGLRQESTSLTTPRDLLALYDQIFAVLSYAHARGVVHRDLKPDNILVTRLGAARICKLLDFGIAKNDASPIQDDQKTEVVGTPRYMAPEQVLADPVGPAADLYSLGVMLFESLTGETPIPGSGNEVMKRKLSEDAPRLSQTRFGRASSELSALVANLLERDPAARTANAADARSALLATPEAQESVSTPASQRIPSARPSDSLETRREGVGTALQPSRQLPFVGRRDERAMLADTLAEVSATGEGRMAIIEGATGIGKSHLMEWFVRQVREEGGRTVVGGSYVEAGGPTGDAIRGAIERHLGGASKSREDLRQSVQRFLSRHGVTDDDEELLLTDWLRPHSPLAAEGLASEARRTQQFALAERTLRRLCERRPSVVFLDDLQWGGRTALDLLSFMMAMWRQTQLPIMIVACLRTPLDDRDLRHAYRRIATHEGRQVVRLPLEPIAIEDTRRLVESILQDRALVHVDAVAKRAAGNPLFAIQLAHLARDAPTDAGEPSEPVTGTRSERRPSDSQIPASVQQLIETRIDVAIARARDQDISQTVLTELAVLLPPAPTALVELALARTGIKVSDAQQALDDLVGSGLVHERLLEGVEALDFDHPLVAETLLARLNLRVMRRQSAEALSLKEAFYANAVDSVVHQLAEHAYHAQLSGRATELGLAAAKRALNAARYGEAMKFVRRLASISGRRSDAVASHPVRTEIALLSSRIAEETGDARFAESVLSHSLDEQDEDALEIVLALARVQVRVGRIAEAEVTIAKAERLRGSLATQGVDLGVRARSELLRLRASIARRQGRATEAIALLEKVFALDEDIPPAQARLLYDNLAWARHRAGDPEAIRDAQRALELSAPGLERGWGMRTLAVVGADALTVEERRDHLERALGVGRELGAFRLATSALTHLGDLERAAQNPAKAREHFQQVITIGYDHTDHDDYSESLANLATMELEAGELASAHELLDSRPGRGTSWERGLTIIKAAADLESGRTSTGIAHLEGVRIVHEAIPSCWGVARAAERVAQWLRCAEGAELADRIDLAEWASATATSAWERLGQRGSADGPGSQTTLRTNPSDVTRRES